MSATRISCPSCSATLRTSADAGTKIRCPSCEKIFRVEEPEEAPPPRRPSTVQADKPVRKPVRRDDEDDEDEAPARPKGAIKRRDDEGRVTSKRGLRRDDEDDEDDEDRPSRKKGGRGRKSEGGSNKT